MKFGTFQLCKDDAQLMWTRPLGLLAMPTFPGATLWR